MIGAAVVVLIAGLLIALAFLPIDCDFGVAYRERQMKTELEIRFLFLRIHPMKWEKRKKKEKKQPAEKKDTEGSRGFQRIWELLQNGARIFGELKDELIELLRYTAEKGGEVRLFQCGLDFGFSDAAVTGMMTGVLNGVIYNIYGFLDRYMRIRETKIEIQPFFQEERMELRLRCILRLRLAYIMVVAVKAAGILLKIRKLNKLGGKDYGTSDSGADGHSNVKY